MCAKPRSRVSLRHVPLDRTSCVGPYLDSFLKKKFHFKETCAALWDELEVVDVSCEYIFVGS